MWMNNVWSTPSTSEHFLYVNNTNNMLITQVFKDYAGVFLGATIPHWESVYQQIKKFECIGSVVDAPQSDSPKSVRTDANRETVVLTFIENLQTNM